MNVLLIASTSFSQKAIIKEIKDINPISKEKYVFPEIVIPGNQISTKKINKILQEETLELDSTGYKKSVFENIWERENTTGGFGGWTYTDFEYKIYSNTEHFTSLSISFIGGKWSQSQIVYYLFDTYSGQKIKLSQVLTQAGQKWLGETMFNAQNNRVKKIIVSLEDSLKLPGISANAEIKEDTEEELEMYKDCLDKAYPFHDAEYMDELVVYIQNDQLYVEGCGCAYNRNSERLDELGEYKFISPFTNLSKYLSPYGKQIFLALVKTRKKPSGLIKAKH